MDYIETEMLTSLATIILVILCIGVFISYGAHLAFYGLGVITLIIGFANAWLIAKSGKQGKGKEAAPAPKGRRKKR